MKFARLFPVSLIASLALLPLWQIFTTRYLHRPQMVARSFCETHTLSAAAQTGRQGQSVQGRVRGRCLNRAVFFLTNVN